VVDRTNDRAHLPGGLRVDVSPTDEAVYIGTVVYYRDEFFDIKRVQIVDEYDREVAVFAARFGPGVRLRKSIVRPVR